ncbi:MAG: hypothetical protein WCI29_04325 [Actinomycetes bacterium]
MTDSPAAGEEIVRLFTAAQTWLRDQAPHLAPVDADGQTCSCPLCQVIVAVRDVDPSSAGLWIDSALASFTSTLASYVETASAQWPSSASRETDTADGSSTSEPLTPEESE